MVTRTRKGRSCYGGSASGKPKPKTKLLDGIKHVLDLVQYELSHDPYRGLCADRSRDSPWFHCARTAPLSSFQKNGTKICKPVDGDADAVMVYDDSSPAVASAILSAAQAEHPLDRDNLVYCVTGGNCGSLHLWTKEAKDKARKASSRRRNKRKRGSHALDSIDDKLGRRPVITDALDDELICCPCDANPFCWATLGGAMDDFLGQARKRIPIERPPIDEEDSIQDPDDEEKDEKKDNTHLSLTKATKRSSPFASPFFGKAKHKSNPLSINRKRLETKMSSSDESQSGLKVDFQSLNSASSKKSMKSLAPRVVIDVDNVGAEDRWPKRATQEVPIFVQDGERATKEVPIFVEDSALPTKSIPVTGADDCHIIENTDKIMPLDLTQGESDESTASIGVAKASKTNGVSPSRSAPFSPSHSRPASKQETAPSGSSSVGKGNKTSIQPIIADLFSRSLTTRLNQRIDMQHVLSAYDSQIAFCDDELDPYNEEASIFSKMTREDLALVRQRIHIRLATVEKYAHENKRRSMQVMRLKQRRGITPLTPNIADHLSQLQVWHRSLLFENPVAPSSCGERDQPDERKFVVALPPGIRNLGATCYLNTQLQCLARITVFMDGIISWKSSDENKDDIMDSVLSELQQLLAKMVHGHQGVVCTNDLSRALRLEKDEMQDPNEFARLLFERMHESFVACSSSSSASKSEHKEDSQLSLARLLPRLFQGRSRYETVCQACGKRTHRDESFMDLNLNILQSEKKNKTQGNGQQKLEDAFGSTTEDITVQRCLDEYMTPEQMNGDNQYHCESCKSKQDATRSLSFTELPPVLNLQLCRYVFDRKTFARKKLSDKVLLSTELVVPGSDEKYQLCAVMRHQGTTAYSGHYVAEAMDWQTGLWFEFNDEKVQVLPRGPSCSINNSSSPTAGSDGIHEEHSGTLKMKTTKIPKIQGSTDAYNMYYVRESFLAENSFTASGRDTTTDCPVLTKLISVREAHYNFLYEQCNQDGEKALLLKRRRLALTRLLLECIESKNESHHDNSNDELLASSVWVDRPSLIKFLGDGTVEEVSAALWGQKALCEHGTGIHPEVARYGKALPRVIALGLDRIVRREELYVGGGRTELGALDHQRMINVEDVGCSECAKRYQGELSSKVEQLALFEELFEHLESNSEDLGENQKTFALSTRFITRLKNMGKNIVKSINTSVSKEDTVAKLDCLMASFFKLASDNDVDLTVNKAICCSHNKCCVAESKRQVRFVTESTWFLIQQLFPDAIQLRHVEGMDISEERCKECRAAENEKDDFLDWVKETRMQLGDRLVNFKRSAADLCVEFQASTAGAGPAEGTFVLIHSNDMKRFRDAVDLIERNRLDIGLLLTKLNDNMFGHSAGSNTNTDRIISSWNPTPLICQEHKSTVDCFLEIGTSAERYKLSPKVEVLTTKEYGVLIDRIYELYRLLPPESLRELPPDPPLSLTNLHTFFHPTVAIFQDEQGTMNNSVELVLEKKSLRALVLPRICTLSHGPIQVHDVDNDQVLVVQPEPKDDSEISVCICEVGSSDGSLQKALNSIRMTPVVSPVDGSDSLLQNLPRRSGRRRKRRFPTDAIEREETLNVRADHNLASLRLRMAESCIGFQCDDKLTFAFPNMVPTRTGQLEDSMTDKAFTDFPRVEVPFEWNTKVLFDVVESMTVGWKRLPDNANEDMIRSLIILRNASRQGKKRDPNELTNEELMASLIEVANIPDDQTVGHNAKKKKRRVERGFQGTFLQGALTKQASSPDSHPRTTASQEKGKDPKHNMSQKNKLEDLTKGLQGKDNACEQEEETVGANQTHKFSDQTEKEHLVMDKLINAIAGSEISGQFDYEVGQSAVAWAILQQPRGSLDDLLDSAYAKYLSHS